MMFKRLAFLNGVSLLMLTAAYADSSATFLGPTIHGSYTTSVTENAALSIAADAGNRNARVGATAGFQVMPHERLKISAEYLAQQLPYSYFVGDQRRWIGQAAVGINYQSDLFTEPYRPQLDFSAYGSHSNSSNIGTVSGITTIDDTPTEYTDIRHVAGSNAFGASPGINAEIWSGTRLGIAANFDDVRYLPQYSGPTTIQGWGGTMTLTQIVTDNVDIGLSAGVRKPFNAYQASVTWNNIPYYGDWSIGLLGDYVAGKSTLPNTYNITLTFSYLFDQCDEPSTTEETATRAFLANVAKPAVRMPAVLAVADEGLTLTSLGGL